jgi:ribosomal protein S27E
MAKPAEIRADGKRRVACCRCGRTLAYADPDPVRPEKEIEIKCHDCNEMNYLMGRDEAA